MNRQPVDESVRVKQENTELREEVKTVDESGDGELDCDDVDALRKENLDLRLTLLRYKDIKEDLAAEKLFQTAKKRLIAWMTIGGTALTAASIFGAIEAKDYVKTMVDSKLNSVTQQKLSEILNNQAHDQIALLVQPKVNEMAVALQHQVSEQLSSAQRQFLQSVSPIAGAEDRSASVSLTATTARIDFTGVMLDV